MPDLEHHFIHTNDIRLHVVQSGPEDGPLVILLHGFPEFWYGWRHQIDALAAQGLRVWAPDQRGYNLSDKPDGLDSYRLNILARDIIGLILASGRTSASIAGHDWGAMVAWWLGIRYPSLVEKLAILNVPHPAVFKHTLLTSLEQMRRSWYAMAFQLPLLPEATLRNNDWQLAVEMLRISSRPGTFSETDFELYRTAWWQPRAMTSMINWYRAYLRRSLDMRGDLRVHVPTLMLWGMNDAALSRKMVQPSIEMCDKGRLVRFDNATHWVQHEEADRVNELLAEHFKG